MIMMNNKSVDKLNKIRNSSIHLLNSANPDLVISTGDWLE